MYRESCCVLELEPHPVLLRTHAAQAWEKLAEGRGVSEAADESAQQVATKDFRPVCFQTVHPAVPAFFGQVVAYKNRQIFIQRVHIGGKDTNYFL